MTRRARVAGLVGGGVLVVALGGCAAVDTVIWGAEGAHVISTTEDLISAAAAGDAGEFLCADAQPDLGEPDDWAGLSAEEPERFVAEYWPDRFVALDPDWSINLSPDGDAVTAGLVFPGDLLYRTTDDGLCLVDVAWSTVVG